MDAGGDPTMAELTDFVTEQGRNRDADVEYFYYSPSYELDSNIADRN